MLGFCIGAVVGLVAITPGSGFVGVAHSAFIGFVAALVSNMVCVWKARTTLDDTLDVFPCHGIGGIAGMLMTGIFASNAVNPGAVIVDAAAGVNHQGLFFGGDLFFTQFKGMIIVATYSFVVGWLIFKFINLINPIRVSEMEEEAGLDSSQHGEAYVQGTLLVKNGAGPMEEKPNT